VHPRLDQEAETLGPKGTVSSEVEFADDNLFDCKDT
jgi:hypothetical protein